jgi:hypothetical protein
MQERLFYNDLRTAQATSLPADSYAPLSLYFLPFTQKIIPAAIFLYLVSVAMHYDINAMHYDIDAMHYDINAMHYDIDAMHYDIVAMHYDIVAMHYDIDAMHYDIDAMHYDIVAMTRSNLRDKGIEWWLNREESKEIMCYV